MPILTEQERIGTVVADKYRIDRVLGRGGMGVVFAGVHTWTGRDVALKILKPDYAGDPVIVRRFLQEARTAATLSHPNVVDVLDMGVDAEGTVYLVLELLRGESLTERIAGRGRLGVSETLELLLPVMDALAEAHVRGIVHRDVKPDNMYLSVDTTNVMVPKLLDFGIAKVMDEAAGARGGGATRTGTIIGTAAYMAPEQAAARADVGPAVDVWAMAVVLFECMSGTLPFVADSTPGMLLAIVNTRAPGFASVVPALPATLATVLDRGLHPDRAQRYPDMATFLEAITDAARAGGLADVVSGVRRIDRALDIVVTRETTERMGMAPTAAPTTGSLRARPVGPREDTLTPTVARSPTSSRRRRGVIASFAVLAVGIVATIAFIATHATPPASVPRRPRAAHAAPIVAPPVVHAPPVVSAPPPEHVVATGIGAPPPTVVADAGAPVLAGHAHPPHGGHRVPPTQPVGVSSGPPPPAGANGAPILE